MKQRVNEAERAERRAAPKPARLAMCLPKLSGHWPQSGPAQTARVQRGGPGEGLTAPT